MSSDAEDRDKDGDQAGADYTASGLCEHNSHGRPEEHEPAQHECQCDSGTELALAVGIRYDAYGFDAGPHASVSVATFEQVSPMTDMLYLDKAWSALQSLSRLRCELAQLAERDAAWRLVRADSAPVIAGLLGGHLGGSHAPRRTPAPRG